MQTGAASWLLPRLQAGMAINNHAATGVSSFAFQVGECKALQCCIHTALMTNVLCPDFISRLLAAASPLVSHGGMLIQQKIAGRDCDKA